MLGQYKEISCTINCCPEELGCFLGKSCHLHDGSIICVGCHEKFAVGTSYVPVLSSFDQLSRLSDGLKVAQTLEHSRLLIT